MAFFLGKVAPLWLSVGVGGMCFIVGGTYATVTCGEYLWQEGELALERRRLASSRQTGTTPSGSNKSNKRSMSRATQGTRIATQGRTSWAMTSTTCV